MDETLGTVSLSQTPSARSLSLISHANMVELSPPPPPLYIVHISIHLPRTQQSVPGCRACPESVHPPAQDLADAAVADPQLSGDVAGPDALVGQLHYPLPHHVREGSAVHKHPAELVHTPVPYVGYNSSTHRSSGPGAEVWQPRVIRARGGSEVSRQLPLSQPDSQQLPITCQQYGKQSFCPAGR
ncbi:hypothetical protein EYF80_005949 [Liparis tanakae]|uniref:Uncharacterized protein n=1 Tax=Liparis tanakae TaxID=230148 RepID=A0A4Z2J2Q8_9TELE|nr:hypothetical protein EYF80_005949 [Liparis tanakae]